MNLELREQQEASTRLLINQLFLLVKGSRIRHCIIFYEANTLSLHHSFVQAIKQGLHFSHLSTMGTLIYPSVLVTLAQVERQQATYAP